MVVPLNKKAQGIGVRAVQGVWRAQSRDVFF